MCWRAYVARRAPATEGAPGAYGVFEGSGWYYLYGAADSGSVRESIDSLHACNVAMHKTGECSAVCGSGRHVAGLDFAGLPCNIMMYSACPGLARLQQSTHV